MRTPRVQARDRLSLFRALQAFVLLVGALAILLQSAGPARGRVASATSGDSYGYDLVPNGAPAALLVATTVPSAQLGRPARSAPLGGVDSAIAASVVGAESEGEFVNLATEARTQHILEGEVRPDGSFGGGHRFGTGFPKKSEFPESWSDEEVMHNISDVATDPSLAWRAGDRPGDFWVNGTRNGLDIEVLIRRNQIWTAYPTNVEPNP